MMLNMLPSQAALLLNLNKLKGDKKAQAHAVGMELAKKAQGLGVRRSCI